MPKRLHQPQFAIAFAVLLAVVSLLVLAGSLAIAAPSAAPDATQPHQATPGTTTITDTTAVTDTAEHLLHHPEEAAASVTETVSVPGMMGMMGEMMSMMGGMQGMMGEGMMMGSQMTSTIPMTDSMAMMGSTTMSDCMMIGPMMSMMGSMMSMMGAMQTMQGMMAGHAMMGQGMMGQGMMGGMGMMGSTAMTGTMPMQGAMPMTGTLMGPGMMGMGMMGMMEGSEMGFMLDHMMQMMGQMQAMVTMCQQGTAAEAGQAVDLGFIDSMIEHHEGAVVMARQALEQAEHEEIRQMAEAIISAQEGEIAQMQAWRNAWYPDAAPSAGMGMDMGAMEIVEGEQPFDLRFIDAMISHHEGAIAMAQELVVNADHDEVKQLAQDIIDAQQAEIAQLQEWRAAWYPDAQ